MNYTNLNIVDSDHQFKYIIERQTAESPSTDAVPYYSNGNEIGFLCDRDNLIFNNNYWVDVDDIETSTEYIPTPHTRSKIILYYPRFSVETYEKLVKYALTVYTWILGKKIILGSVLLDRQDALAISTGPRTFLNDKYYEYASIDIIDPYELLYNDSWKDWRREVCGDDRGVFNDGGSNIGVNLCVVENINGYWIKRSGYEESQSSILITDNVDDYLSCHIKTNVDGAFLQPKINCSICFNSNYEQSSEGLAKYLYETYGIEASDVNSKFVLMVQDKENMYKIVEHKYSGVVSSDFFTKDMLGYESWNDYMDGLKISVLYQIVHDESDEEIEWMSFMSNYIFFDQELFKYFVGENYINQVKLSQVNMNNYNIDVVNKVVNNIVSVERPDDYKANIIKPVFFKVQDALSIVIHPAVTENICINLDAYKNKVNVFSIKIGDSTFKEIGRTTNGVIFKIIGVNVNVENGDTGTYYILNDVGELVTTGKYSAVM